MDRVSAPRTRLRLVCLLVLAPAGFAALMADSCLEYDESLLLYRDASAPQTDSSNVGDAAQDHDSSTDSRFEANHDQATESDAVHEPVDPRACDPCKDPALLRAPCKPDVPDPTSIGRTLVYAMDHMSTGMDMNKPDDWKTTGVDIDCLNTTSSGTPLQCKRVAGAQAKMMQDGDQGRDNSFGLNIGGFICLLESGGLAPNVEQGQNQTMLEGSGGGLLFTIENFGGMNDPRVTFTVYLSRGVIDPSGDQAAPAKWDGTDVWSIDSDSVGESNVPLFRDDAAYVNNGIVVARLADGAPFKFADDKAALTVALNHAVVVMQLSDDLKRVVDASVTGAWKTVSALTSIAAFAAGWDICPGNFQYQAAAVIVQQSSDLRLDLAPDPTLDCDAISIALGFGGSEAKLGPIVSAPPPNPAACDAGADAGD